jgi:hypothetical protein
VIRFVAAAVVAACLSGCAGYHIGPVQPYYLREVHTISVPTLQNKTMLPRIEVLVTDTIIKQFQQDGTYQIVGDDKADAILEGSIVQVNRNPARSVGGNVLATVEFNLNMRVHYSLIRRSDKKPIAGPGDAVGSTSFFVGADVTADERQALPLAAEELAKSLVSQLSEGW